MTLDEKKEKRDLKRNNGMVVGKKGNSEQERKADG